MYPLDLVYCKQFGAIYVAIIQGQGTAKWPISRFCCGELGVRMSFVGPHLTGTWTNTSSGGVAHRWG